MATFQLTDTVEFKRWIKGFGAGAEVLTPNWLRRQIHDELLAAVQKHADRPPES